MIYKVFGLISIVLALFVPIGTYFISHSLLSELEDDSNWVLVDEYGNIINESNQSLEYTPPKPEAFINAEVTFNHFLVKKRLYGVIEEGTNDKGKRSMLYLLTYGNQTRKSYLAFPIEVYEVSFRNLYYLSIGLFIFLIFAGLFLMLIDKKLKGGKNKYEKVVDDPVDNNGYFSFSIPSVDDS